MVREPLLSLLVVKTYKSQETVLFVENNVVMMGSVEVIEQRTLPGPKERVGGCQSRYRQGTTATCIRAPSATDRLSPVGVMETSLSPRQEEAAGVDEPRGETDRPGTLVHW